MAAISVAGVLLVAPSVALADSCQGGPSAVNIYSECIPTAGGGSHHQDGGGTSTYPTPFKLTKKLAHTLKRAGADKKLLSMLVRDPWLGAPRAVQPSSFRATKPSALGAVFDLGSGPTALFSLLAASAVLLFGVGGIRSFRGLRQRQK